MPFIGAPAAESDGIGVAYELTGHVESGQFAWVDQPTSVGQLLTSKKNSWFWS
jgi:hypothetical protein